MRVVVAEDAVLLREGLAGLLQRFGHTVIASVADAEAMLEAVDRDRPDIVITDVRMPPAFTDEGLRAAMSLRARHPGLPVLVLSQYVEQTYATEFLSAGTGYLLKARVGEVAEFIEAVVKVDAGGTVVDAEVVRQLLDQRHRPLQRLTPREREVLALMAERRSNSAISRVLVITEAAVAKHIASILSKLDLPPHGDDHRRVLAVLALLRG